MRNAGLDDLQAGIKIGRRNLNNLRYADDTTLMAERAEELKSLLMRVKEESGKSWLKTKYWGKKKITASQPIPAWQVEEGKMEMATGFLFLGSKITADGDCSHEIRCLLLGRKAFSSVLKSRDITLLTKIHIVKAMVFPLGTHGCECWSIKKAEHQIIDTFKVWCWRRLLRVTWTARKSNQSILRRLNNPHWEGMMLS